MTFKEPNDAFNAAISEGRLSANKAAENWAGYFMYMGTDEKGRDLFKHSGTRKYIPHLENSLIDLPLFKLAIDKYELSASNFIEIADGDEAYWFEEEINELNKHLAEKLCKCVKHEFLISVDQNDAVPFNDFITDNLAAEDVTPIRSEDLWTIATLPVNGTTFIGHCNGIEITRIN